MKYFQDSRSNRQKQEIHYQHHSQSHRSMVTSIMSRNKQYNDKKRMSNRNIDHDDISDINISFSSSLQSNKRDKQYQKRQ